jgi:ribosomal protein S6
LYFVCAALPPHLSPPAVHGGGNPKEGTLLDNSKYLSPRAYEMLAVLVPDQGDEETSAAIERMLSFITDEQGTIDSVASDSPWGRRRLAYTIRHEGVDYRDGHYVLVYFTAMPSAISEIERELKLDTNVIRYLLLTHDPHMGEQIDPNALDAEGTQGSDEAPAAVTPAETTEAPADATEAPAAVAEQAPVETADAPAEEVAAPVEEVAAPANEAAAPVEEAAASANEVAEEEAASVTEDTTADVVAVDEAATEEAPAEAVTEETAADGEVEESTEE